MGTRHRAALGLAEEADAVVVVISEETGNLSIAHRAALRRCKDDQELFERISRIIRAGAKGEEEAVAAAQPPQEPSGAS